MKPQVGTERIRGGAVVATYFATLALFALCAIRPDGRVWGLDHGAHWGSTALGITGALLALVPSIVNRLLPRERPRNEAEGEGVGRLLLLGAVVAIVFVRFRSTMHFLGDGEQTLSLLAADPPFVKETAPLLRLLLPRVRDLFGSDAARAALHVYQTVSIASGVAFVLASALFARTVLVSRLDRMLFLSLVLSSGPMLLFFGYVENYAPFVAFLGMTCMAGVAVLERRIPRAWILPPALFTVAAHFLGILILPAVLYALFTGSRIVRRTAALPRIVPIVIAAAVFAAGVATIRSLAARDPRIGVAFLPLTSTWATPDGYTLISRNHLVDLANLTFQLVPGFAVLAAFWLSHRVPLVPGGPVRVFFGLLLLPSMLAVFVLCPEIGMPRDWDLFAFAAVPFVIGSGTAFLRHPGTSRPARASVALAAALGFAVLGARVAEGIVEDVAVRRFAMALDLDKSKGRAGRSLLIAHFVEKGETGRAEAESRRYDVDYPERAIERRVHELQREGRLDEAMSLAREVLKRDPRSRDALMLLGEGLLLTGRHEESIRVSRRAFAVGGDPFRCAQNLGLAHAWLGRFDEAERWLRRALVVQPMSYEANLTLAKVYEMQGRRAQFAEHLGRAARSERAAPDVVAQAKELGLPVR